MKLFAVLSIATLAACTNADGTMGQPGSPAWMGSATPQQQTAYFGQVCQNYGFSAGSPEIIQCIAQETRSARDNRSRAISAIAASNQTTTCTTYGNTTVCN